MENQTWWDAACNMDPNDSKKDWWGWASVTSEEQFISLLLEEASSLLENVPEESFMFLCFMSEAFDHDQG